MPRNGACITCTSVVRNAKQTIMAATSVIAIFTMVQRRSSRCSRNGFDDSLSGISRNLKMSCSAMLNRQFTRESFRSRSAGFKREKTAHGQARGHAQRVGIANFILRNHAREFGHAERSTINDLFGFLADVRMGARLNRTRQKEVTVLIGKSRR